MRYRARLDFSSVLKFSSVLGLCAGIGGTPIIALAQSDKLIEQPFFIAVVVVVAPILGFLNGLLWGLVGYLPYRWLTERVNVHTYTGEFIPVDEASVEA